MKYFIAHGFVIHQNTMMDSQKVVSEKDFEITRERAFNMYKERAGSGNLNLIAIPNFNKGKEVVIRRGSVRLWGEDISEQECFRRRLVGSLHTDVQE